MPRITNPVTGTPAAEPTDAAAHFAALLRLETDCWDVHTALRGTKPGFVLIDVRSPEAYDTGHLPNAVNLPHARIVERTLDDLPPTDLYVVYCAGPHCNAADRAALRLAQLGRPVKKMIGGVTGWLDEGFDLVG